MAFHFEKTYHSSAERNVQNTHRNLNGTEYNL